MKPKSRRFNGIPVREARAAILVQPNKEDIRRATRKDPENCAYARCLRRILDAPNVFIFEEIAYVQTLDEKGRPVMERYHLRRPAQQYLQKFDRGEKTDPAGFTFDVPPKCKTLNEKMAKYYDYKARGGKTRGGKTSGPKNTGATKAKAKTYSLRNGKGAVHFITAEQIKVNREQ